MIFYISGTGNTKWAAAQISEAVNERLIDISKAAPGPQNYELGDGERIGFCFPVHGWRPPMIMRNFIKRLSVKNIDGHYSYALCTAGDTIGETVDILRNDLHARRIHLDGAFSLIMPESYVGLPFMDVDTPDNENRKKQHAAEDLKHYTELIVKREKSTEHLTVGKWPRINSRLLGAVFTNHMITDKPFRVTEDKCIKCGICAESCPVSNITMTNGGYPQWAHDGSCLACFSCYHHCPRHAIEYGKRTKNKGQYYFSHKK